MAKADHLYITISIAARETLLERANNLRSPYLRKSIVEYDGTTRLVVDHSRNLPMNNRPLIKYLQTLFNPTFKDNPNPIDPAALFIDNRPHYLANSEIYSPSFAPDPDKAIWLAWQEDIYSPDEVHHGKLNLEDPITNDPEAAKRHVNLLQALRLTWQYFKIPPFNYDPRMMPSENHRSRGTAVMVSGVLQALGSYDDINDQYYLAPVIRPLKAAPRGYPIKRSNYATYDRLTGKIIKPDHSHDREPRF